MFTISTDPRQLRINQFVDILPLNTASQVHAAHYKCDEKHSSSSAHQPVKSFNWCNHSISFAHLPSSTNAHIQKQAINTVYFASVINGSRMVLAPGCVTINSDTESCT